MKKWYLVSFSFLDMGLLFYNLVLTDNEDKIVHYFSGNEEIHFRPLEMNEVNILKKAKIDTIELVTK